MTAGSAASRRVLARTPVAPLPASSPTRPTGITGRMSAPPETSSPGVCSFRLPQMCGFRLPLTQAARRFFRKLLKGQGRAPRRLITDKLRSYSAAHRTVMPSVVHSTQQYENNRAEVSHQPTRQRERQMRRFTSAAHAQRFLSVHGLVQNLFRVGRHLLRAGYHRSLRTRSFRVWDEVTYAC